MKSLLNSHSQTVVAKEKSALMSARLSWRPLRILRDLCGSSLSLFALILLAAFLFAPTPAHAYAGPGAGFAVLSSFWTLFVAFLYSAYAMFTWPFRHILRLLRRRKAYGKRNDQASGDPRFRRYGPRTHGTFHRRRPPSELSQTPRAGNFPQTSHDLSCYFARCLVDVHDRSESRQAQHLRFPRARR